MNINSINEFVNEFTAGRSDFLDAIVNENSGETLDFSQFEALLENSNNLNIQSNEIYPDSPPDSEPPYSPNYFQHTQQNGITAILPQNFPPESVQSTLIEIENNVSIDEQLQTNIYQHPYLVNNGLLSPDHGSSSVTGSVVALSPQQQMHSPIEGFKAVRLPSIIYPHSIQSALATTIPTDLPQSPAIVNNPSITSRKRKNTALQTDEFVWKTNSKSDQEVLSLENEIVAAIPSLSSNNDEQQDQEISSQTIKFHPFQKLQWATICDQNLHESQIPQYRVDADKGFNFSTPDDAFVCQKKNHFQITCHVQIQGTLPIFITTKNGLEKILEFYIHFYGVKFETPNQHIRIEQSQPDRTKKPFNPVKIDLQKGPVKLSIGRLHFSETTGNNMRKKGRPNPDQKYFQLIVGLHAETHSGNFPIVSMGSERIIVRASNPGQFDNLETNMETAWANGDNGVIYHNGMVGINTDRVEESLVVNGNIKVSGQILANSDMRAKQEIYELDSREQLKNIQKIRVVRYRYEPEFARKNGLTSGSGTMDQDYIDTGVIAQEIQKILPDAVKQQKGRILVNGEFIEDFLLINKDRIFMENIGAIKELCKLTGSLETRIQQLERINTRLSQRKEPTIKKIDMMTFDRNHLSQKPPKYRETFDYCSNKMIQAVIVFLIFIILASLTCLSTLYFMEHRGQQQPLYYMAGIRSGSDANSIDIQKEFLPKINGKYYTFAPHNSQAINSNHKSATPDNLYSKNLAQENGLTDTESGDGLHNWKQKKNNESKTQTNIKVLTNKGDIKTSVYIQTVEKSDDENILVSEDELTTDSRTINVPEIGLTKEQQQCLSENNNIDGSNSLCVNPCNRPVPASMQSKANDEINDSPTGEEDIFSNLETSPQVNQSGVPGQTFENEQSANDNIIKNLIIPATEIEAEFGFNFNQTQIELDHPVATKSSASILDERPPNLNDSKDVKLDVASKNEVDGQQNEHLLVDEIENHNSAQYLEQKKQNAPQQLTRPEIPPPVQQQSPSAQTQIEDCTSVTLRIKADFNLTLGTDEICHRQNVDILNITYSIPVSKFMKETDIELQFLSPKNVLEWVLCSSNERKTHDNVATAGLTKSIYPLKLPLDSSSFEKNLVFRTIMTSTEPQESRAKLARNICDESPKKYLGHYLQYNIKLYRDC